jgi:hypothetical protein
VVKDYHCVCGKNENKKIILEGIKMENKYETKFSNVISTSFEIMRMVMARLGNEVTGCYMNQRLRNKIISPLHDMMNITNGIPRGDLKFIDSNTKIQYLGQFADGYTQITDASFKITGAIKRALTLSETQKYVWIDYIDRIMKEVEHMRMLSEANPNIWDKLLYTNGTKKEQETTVNKQKETTVNKQIKYPKFNKVKDIRDERDVEPNIMTEAAGF